MTLLSKIQSCCAVLAVCMLATLPANRADAFQGFSTEGYYNNIAHTMGVSLGVAPQLLALSFTNLILMMEVIEDYASNVCEESDAERWSDAIIKASWYYCVSYKGSPKDRPHVNHELGNWLNQESSRNLWPYKQYFTFHRGKKNTVADRILRNATAGRNFFLAGTHHPFYVMEPWELKNMVSRCTSRQ